MRLFLLPAVVYQFSPSETRAEIMGGTEVHVELGSTLNLTCVVRNTRERPHYLLWYHRNQVDQLSLAQIPRDTVL